MSGLAATLLLGSVHGIVLAVVLLRRDRARRANQYLAALLGLIALMLLDGFARAMGVMSSHPELIGLTAWVPFALGPLVFLYVREMTASAPPRPPWRHFLVPGADVAMLLVTFYPRSGEYKLAIAQHETSTGWLASIAVFLVIYGSVYAGAALVLLRRHRAHIQEQYSNLRGVSLRWLVVLASLNALVWVGALVAFVLRATGASDASAAGAIVPIGSTAVIFVIGYFQLGQPALPPPLPAPGPAKPQYARARLAEDDASTLETRIRAAMTERHLYQRPGLTLADLADEVAATPHEVSQVLSTRLQRNFYAFINEHRIDHVKAALAASDRPVLDLALEAGFQSKSTFNTAFRKATGMTPREFRERAKS